MNSPQALQDLVFAASDDGAEQGSWEAMASVQSSDLPGVMAEVATLLAVAEQEAPGTRGAEEEGGLWDAHLQQHQEPGGWTTVTLTLTGPWDWGERLRMRFEADAE